MASIRNIGPPAHPRHPADFVTPADLIPEILGSWEREYAPFSAELEVEIIKAQLHRWSLQRLPLFRQEAA